MDPDFAEDCFEKRAKEVQKQKVREKQIDNENVTAARLGHR